jgi:alcohol dehydrogenase (cytochrome c)
VALDVETGKIRWHYQTSPHDMHDYDSAQTPILADLPFNGKMRRLAMTAARNGCFFTLDRVTGERLVSAKHGMHTNRAKGLNRNGALEHDPVKDPTVGGTLVSPTVEGTVNWQPPAFSLDAGLFYVPEWNTFSIFYLMDLDPQGSMGLGGKEEVGVGSPGTGRATLWRTMRGRGSRCGLRGSGTFRTRRRRICWTGGST